MKSNSNSISNTVNSAQKPKFFNLNFNSSNSNINCNLNVHSNCNHSHHTAPNINILVRHKHLALFDNDFLTLNHKEYLYTDVDSISRISANTCSSATKERLMYNSINPPSNDNANIDTFNTSLVSSGLNLSYNNGSKVFSMSQSPFMKVIEITVDEEFSHFISINNCFKADAFCKTLLSIVNRDTIRSVEFNKNRFYTYSNLLVEMAGEHMLALIKEIINLNKIYFIDMNISNSAFHILVKSVLEGYTKFIYLFNSIDSFAKLNILSYMFLSNTNVFLSILNTDFTSFYYQNSQKNSQNPKYTKSININEFLCNLSNSKNLVYLDLSNSKIEEAMMIEILVCLKSCQRLYCLILNDMQINYSANFYQVLSELICESPSLEYLDIKNNVIVNAEYLLTTMLISNLKIIKLFGINSVFEYDYPTYVLLDRLIHQSANIVYLDISGVLFDYAQFPRSLEKKTRLHSKIYVNILACDVEFLMNIYNIDENLLFIYENCLTSIIEEVDPIKIYYEVDSSLYSINFDYLKDESELYKYYCQKYNYYKNYEFTTKLSDILSNLRNYYNYSNSLSDSSSDCDHFNPHTRKGRDNNIFNKNNKFGNKHNLSKFLNFNKSSDPLGNRRGSRFVKTEQTQTEYTNSDINKDLIALDLNKKLNETNKLKMRFNQLMHDNSKNSPNKDSSDSHDPLEEEKLKKFLKASNKNNHSNKNLSNSQTNGIPKEMDNDKDLGLDSNDPNLLTGAHTHHTGKLRGKTLHGDFEHENDDDLDTPVKPKKSADNKSKSKSKSRKKHVRNPSYDTDHLFDEYNKNKEENLKKITALKNKINDVKATKFEDDIDINTLEDENKGKMDFIRQRMQKTLNERAQEVIAEDPLEYEDYNMDQMNEKVLSMKKRLSTISKDTHTKMEKTVTITDKELNDEDYQQFKKHSSMKINDLQLDIEEQDELSDE